MAPNKTNGHNVGAGLAGAGSGTGLIALVNLLPEHGPAKQLATYVAPSFAILTTMLWIYATSWLEQSLADRRLAGELKKAEEELRRTESDRSSSLTLKKEMREKVETLRLLKFSVHSKRVQAIIDKD